MGQLTEQVFVSLFLHQDVQHGVMSISSAWMDGYTAGFVHYDDAVLLPNNLDGQIRYWGFVAMNVVGDNVAVLDDVALRNCLVVDFDPAVLNGSLLSSVNICPRNQLVSWRKSESTAEN